MRTTFVCLAACAALLAASSVASAFPIPAQDDPTEALPECWENDSYAPSHRAEAGANNDGRVVRVHAGALGRGAQLDCAA